MSVVGDMPVLYVLSSMLFGFGAILAGRVQAIAWRPPPMTFLFGVMLALGHRFILYALGGADPFDYGGFLVSLSMLCGLAFAGYRYFKVLGVCRQYPWIYERVSWFRYRERVAPRSADPKSGKKTTG